MNRYLWWTTGRPDALIWFALFYRMAAKAVQLRASPLEFLRGWEDAVSCPQCAVAVSDVHPGPIGIVLREWAMALSMNGHGGHRYGGWHA